MKVQQQRRADGVTVITVEFSDLELAGVPFDAADYRVLAECRLSGSVADMFLALELMARRLEEAQARDAMPSLAAAPPFATDGAADTCALAAAPAYVPALKVSASS
jgi:hypothetical protein